MGSPCAAELVLADKTRLELRLAENAAIGQPALVVGISRDDAPTAYVGLKTIRTIKSGDLQVLQVVRGGIGEQILADEGRMPVIQAADYRYERAFSEDLYTQWEAAGILRRVILDKTLVCPKCSALPTFRFACARCHSGRLRQDILVHHFACANVAPLDKYSGDTSLQCPKCRTKHLIAGTDFEYAPGEHLCLDCHWKSRELTQIGHCLQCEFRFPIHQAVEQELEGYDVDRVAALDLIPFVE